MKPTLLITTLFLLTIAAVVFYPAQHSNGSVAATPLPNVDPHVAALPLHRPRIDVVFVLDTTGSMAGLIHAAKEKIWSIATTMASAQPAPEIRMGLVAYRDRGDAYVTKVVDLSTDIDSMYAKLMDLQAEGGGDGPESVNEALAQAVGAQSWSQDNDTYKVIFLVGDAPPHMDYQDDVKYPQTLALAGKKGIIVNTIQCGDEADTRMRWQQIASLSQGSYFNVDQAGSAVAIATPFDAPLAKLSAALDDTRLYYGTAEERERQKGKIDATDKLHALASPASQARRAAFNASASGAANMAGDGELVADVASGRVDLKKLEAEKLPEPLQALSPEARQELVTANAGKRADQQLRIKELADERDKYVAGQVAASGGATESLDYKILSAVREQTKDKGLTYADAPKY
jgi:Mg-chelatase subunit ChlD